MASDSELKSSVELWRKQNQKPLSECQPELAPQRPILLIETGCCGGAVEDLVGWRPNTDDEITMALLINSYSLVAAGLLVIMIVALLTGRLFGSNWATATVAVTFVFLVAFQVTASTKANTVATPEDFNNALISGKPVLVELYSNF